MKCKRKAPKATTGDVLALAQGYVAAGYSKRGWVDAAGYVLDFTSDWEWAVATDSAGAITLACMNLFGDWYSHDEYYEAQKIVAGIVGRSERQTECDWIVDWDHEHGSQDEALRIYDRALNLWEAQQ